MSTGQSTQSAFIQGNQSTREHDVPHSNQHSALFYLFQEVSKLASPIQSTFLDTNSPSTWLKENSRQGPFMVKKEQDDAYSFEISTTSCQAGLHRMVPYNQIKKVREKSHSSKATTLAVGNSPWKVLSMINLQCEKLLHHSDVEQSDKASTATAHRMDQEVGGDCVSVEFTFRPSREEYRLKDSEMSCCVQSQAAEDTVEPELVEEKQNALFQTIHAPNASLNNQLTCNSSVNASIPLLKPEQTLDCNANPIFIMHPLNSIVHSSQSVSTVFSIEEGHSLPKHGDGIAAVQLEGTHTPIEQNNPPAEQCKSSSCNVETNPLSSAASKPEPRPVQNEEFAPSATQQRRNKTRRKQPHPSRSVDIQDPDFQGVTFRMDTELDDSREQCRLLITSKYSKELCKNVRKPRQRIRTSQKSLKTSSSDEENDLTGSVSKGKACASCCTRKTPMWRDAEDGTPLCNACGIRYKKYRVRCINCWHIPRKEGNSISRCFKCGNFVRLISAQCKHTA